MGAALNGFALTASAQVIGPQGIALDSAGGMLYWTDEATDTIQRAALDGSNVEDIVVSGVDDPRSMVVDVAGAKVYWGDSAGDTIHRADLDGAQAEVLVSAGIVDPLGMAIDTSAGKLYWIDAGTDRILRGNLDGTAVETVYDPPGPSQLRRLTIDTVNGHLYWTDRGNGVEPVKIQRADLDGSNAMVILAAAPNRPEGLAVSPSLGKLYWTDIGTTSAPTAGFIRRTNLDGSGVETLVAGLKTPWQIVLDEAGGKMYWTEGRSYRAKVQRANLDGSGVETLVGGAANTIEISCEPVGGTSVLRGQLVEVECLVRSDIDQSFQGGQVDVPCSLPATGGATGSITVESITSDPDGNDLRGPSSDGFPFLFGPGGQGPSIPSTCVSAATPCASCAFPTVAGDTLFYLGTYFYRVSDCADGTFDLDLEGVNIPPTGGDTSRFRDAENGPAFGNFLPISSLPVAITAAMPALGDVNLTGVIDVDDILCVLDAFAGTGTCPGVDLYPCGGNELIDVDDILVMLDAFAGTAEPCPDPCLAP